MRKLDVIQHYTEWYLMRVIMASKRAISVLYCLRIQTGRELDLVSLNHGLMELYRRKMAANAAIITTEAWEINLN